MEAQARLSQHTGRLTKETDRRRHLEALLDEGLQVQSQILLGLQVAGPHPLSPLDAHMFQRRSCFCVLALDPSSMILQVASFRLTILAFTCV